MTQKNRLLCTITQLCRAVSSQLRHISTIEKNLLNSDISPACPHNMVNFGPLMAEIGSGVLGTRANFNVFCVLASLLQGRRSLQTLHDVWLSPPLLHYIFIFGGACPLTEFCEVGNSLCVNALPSPVFAAFLHCTPAAGVSQTLQHGTRNGIMGLPQRAPPIFFWAAITFGISPHSNYYYY